MTGETRLAMLVTLIHFALAALQAGMVFRVGSLRSSMGRP
jgi:hypothetical protein